MTIWIILFVLAVLVVAVIKNHEMLRNEKENALHELAAHPEKRKPNQVNLPSRMKQLPAEEITEPVATYRRLREATDRKKNNVRFTTE
jgi:hypothetical protein